MIAVSRARFTASVAAVCAVAFAMPLSLPRAGADAFAEPVLLPQSGGSEPGIDVAPDGTIYVNSIFGFPRRSPLWRSTDGGESFSKISLGTPYHRFPGGGDADVAVAPDGTLYFLDLWVGSNSITASEDRGTTWARGTPFTTLPLTDRQWIAVGGRSPLTEDDTVYVSYHLIQPPSNLVVSRSSDGGMTWDLHAAPAGVVNSQPGQIVADGDFVAASYWTSGRLFVARSTDRGLGWTTHRIDVDDDVYVGIFSAAGLVLDGDRMYATYIDRDDFSVKVARSEDRGETWNIPERVSPEGVSAMFPWVAVRGEKVAIAWYEADRDGDPNEMPAEAEWRVGYSESLDGGETYGPPIRSPMVAKRGGICSLGLSCAANRELGEFLQVAIGRDGKALVSFVGAADRPGIFVLKQR